MPRVVYSVRKFTGRGTSLLLGQLDYYLRDRLFCLGIRARIKRFMIYQLFCHPVLSWRCDLLLSWWLWIWNTDPGFYLLFIIFGQPVLSRRGQRSFFQFGNSRNDTEVLELNYYWGIKYWSWNNRDGLFSLGIQSRKHRLWNLLHF